MRIDTVVVELLAFFLFFFLFGPTESIVKGNNKICFKSTETIWRKTNARAGREVWSVNAGSFFRLVMSSYVCVVNTKRG